MRRARIIGGMSAARPATKRASIVLRPLEIDDLDALRALDGAYAERYGVEPVVDMASVRHHARSGHAFVACRDDDPAPCAMVLAQAVWDGSRPVVRASRLVALDDDPLLLERLLGALVKSAYDAAVYDLVAEVPEIDAAGQASLNASGFGARAVLRFERVLGSRAAGVP